MDEKKISASLEDYLKTMFQLHQTDITIRISDISKCMEVSKASASHAVTLLAEMGYVDHFRYGPILLTHKGVAVAEGLLAKYNTIKFFLERILGVGEVLAGLEACAIEHNIHEDTLQRMSALLEA